MALTKVKAGNILLTTPSASSNDVTPATTEYVTTALANLADSAPSTLNTLNELAAALGDDANFSTTVTNSIATKLPLAGGTLTGDVQAPGVYIGSTNTSYDLYNNGTSYLNGSVVIDDSLQVTGGFNMSSGTLEFADGNASFDSSNSSGYSVFSHTNGSAQIGFARTGGSTGIGYIGADSTNVFAVWDSSFNRKMVISQAGNVGIGTNDPATKLQVVGALSTKLTDGLFYFSNSSSTTVDTSQLGIHWIGRVDSAGYHMTTTAGGFAGQAGTLGIGGKGGITFGTCTTSETYASGRMIIDASGKVGIGTTSPASLLHVEKSFDGTLVEIHQTRGSASTDRGLDVETSSTGTTVARFKNSGMVLQAIYGNGNVAIFGGTLYVAGDGQSFSAGSHNGHSYNVNGQSVSSRAANNLQTHHSFYNTNGNVGTIKTNASATQFNTSSDYRLKENVVTDWDGTTLLKQLKPSQFNFKADSSTIVQGFLAHEVSSIVPQAVSGDKDAVYTAAEAEDGEGIEGQPNYQGIDHSHLVPLLVKTIQELEARIETLEG